MVSLWWSLILFGGVFITSEWFMNVENDAKYYFMSMAAVVWLMAVPPSPFSDQLFLFLREC